MWAGRLTCCPDFLSKFPMPGTLVALVPLDAKVPRGRLEDLIPSTEHRARSNRCRVKV